MRCKWLFLCLAGLLLFLYPHTSVAQEKSYHANNFDVLVKIEEDGALLIIENVTFTFVGEPFTFVFRELLTEHTDGIEIISAAVDGRNLIPGVNPGQYEVDRQGNINVTWHMEPTANTTRTFTLVYRMLGVVRQTPEADLLRYQALPDQFEYNIDTSTVSFQLPVTAVSSGPPLVTVGEANINENGGTINFQSRNIQANQTLVMEIPFAPGTLVSVPPAWQTTQARQQAWAPMWIGLSLVLLIGGVISAITIWRQHDPLPTSRDGTLFEPPNDLPPAIAGAINNQTLTPSWANALATLFDLAERGILEIEEINPQRWYKSQDFLLRLLKRPENLRQHENGLLEIIFIGKKGPQNEVLFSELSHIISSKKWKEYTDPLEREIKDLGFIDPVRKQRRRWVFTGGVILFSIALVLLLITLLFFEKEFGPWPLFIPLAFLVTFIIYIILASKLSPLTDDGRRIADEWQQFYNYLKSITKGKISVVHEDTFTRFLPYAASYGLLPQWAKKFEKDESTTLPAYFQSLPGADTNAMTAFVAMASYSSSAGGSAAGAGGAGAAGAAGGGASGAG